MEQPKRIPGQTNSQYGSRMDPGSAFLGEQSRGATSGGTWTLVGALRRWLARRPRRRAGGR